MAGGTVESAASRYDRDWLHVNDDRKVRGVDYQSEERRERLYVNRVTGDSAVQRFDRDPKNVHPLDVNYDPNEA